MKCCKLLDWRWPETTSTVATETGQNSQQDGKHQPSGQVMSLDFIRILNNSSDETVQTFGAGGNSNWIDLKCQSQKNAQTAFSLNLIESGLWVFIYLFIYLFVCLFLENVNINQLGRRWVLFPACRNDWQVLILLKKICDGVFFCFFF